MTHMNTATTEDHINKLEADLWRQEQKLRTVEDELCELEAITRDPSIDLPATERAAMRSKIDRLDSEADRLEMVIECLQDDIWLEQSATTFG